MKFGQLILFFLYASTFLVQQAHADVSTCITVPISSVPVLPQTKFSDLRCLPSLNFAGTAREFISGSVVIKSAVSVTDITIKATDLTNGNQTIPASAIDLRYVKVWYQSGSAWQSIRQDKSRRVLIPELLLHNDALIEIDESNERNFLITETGRKIDISTNEKKIAPEIISVKEYAISDAQKLAPTVLKENLNKQIWITIRTPASAQAGEYRGKLLVESTSSNTRKEIPLTLTIYPFDLSEPDLLYSIYYRGVLTSNGEGSISSESKSVQQMAAELVDMREHGISNPTIYQPPTPASLFEKVLTLRSAAGMDNSTLFYLGIQTPIPENVWSLKRDTDNFKNIQSIAKSHNVKKLHVYAIDEAEPTLIPKQKAVWSNYKALGGGIFAADWRPGAERYYAGEVSALVLGASPDRSANQFLQTRGTQSFLYNRPQVGVENPYVYRLQYGLTAWQHGFDGVMDYAYQHAMGNIWNDFDHPDFRDHVFAYPSSDGVIGTIAWEGFREAVTDVRYISTLNKVATTTNSVSDLNYLAALKFSGETDLDNLRKNIADRIITLCKKLKPDEYLHTCPTTGAPGPVNNFKVND